MKKILKVLPKNVKLDIFTSSIIGNYINGASDISALKLLCESRAKIYNYQSLHAKVYMFDNKEAIITSGNLTYSGLNKNFEYGINTDEEVVINSIITDYNELKNSDSCSLLSNSQINSIIKLIEEYKKYKIISDKDNDSILLLDNSNLLKKVGKGWKHLLLGKIILDIPGEEFSLNDVYSFYDYFKSIYPNNSHIKDKLRQILQNLRDLGFIKFIEKGMYKKMYRIEKCNN